MLYIVRLKSFTFVLQNIYLNPVVDEDIFLALDSENLVVPHFTFPQLCAQRQIQIRLTFNIRSF